jgi:toxin-antitoxin system PIN domain toxin
VTYLLDINVLVALFDAAHVHHEPAHQWFSSVGHTSWATCPLTECGFVRVISSPAYPSVKITPGEATERLRTFCNHRGHVFWPDSVALADTSCFDLSQLKGHQQITDLYLAGLAARNGGRLATFDEHIPVAALIGGSSLSIELVPSGT